LVASNLVVTSGRIDITDIYASRTFAGHATCGVARCSNIYIADFVRVGGTVTSTALTAIGMTGSNFACSNMECTGAGTFKASLEVGEPVVATADSQRATLLVQGCVQANNVDDIADMCVMRNVQPATATPTFSNLILDAPIHSFKLNHDLSRTRHGYLASEIETICPEAVYTTTDYTSMIMSNVAQIADNLIELPSAMNVRVGDYVIIANGRRVPVVAATATSASTSTSTVRIAAVDAAAAAAGGSLAGQTTVFIEGIVYNTVKCIDYHQVIMSLCAAVKQLATR
jgi:hypothetical protein